MQAKTERFEMRLDQETIEQVDEWRGRQDDLPSRSEAVRRLVERALGVSGPEGLRFRDSEKLIVSMLCDIAKQVKVKDGVEPDFVVSALYGGHYWALRWKYPGLFHGHEDSGRTLSQVVDILDMWSFMESAYAKLSKKDKDRVKKEAEPFGSHVRFSGFDGNNESEHFGIAMFLVDEMDRFPSFKGRDLNSHSPRLAGYLRMVPVFEPIRATLIGRELTAGEIVELLNAQIHPDRRRGGTAGAAQ